MIDLDELDYRLKVIGEDSDFPKEVILATLQRLPDDVVEWVVESLHFLWPPDSKGVAYGFEVHPSDEPVRVTIVFLAPRLCEETPIEQQRVIAHEIAHHRLGHIGAAQGGEEYDTRERQVDAQLIAWGIEPHEANEIE